MFAITIRPLTSVGCLLTVSEQAYQFGIGNAQRSLGKLAHAAQAPETAEAHLQDALTTFEEMQACFEVGRTHLELAALAQLQDRRDVARRHWTLALKQFSDLQVPRYIELAQNHLRQHGHPEDSHHGAL